MLVGDLNVPPEPEDISEHHPWVTQPRNYETERASFQHLLQCGQVYDTTSKSGFTWHPEPHLYNQRAKVGQRLDLTLLPKDWVVTDCNIRHLDTFSDHRPTIVSFRNGPAIEINYGLRSMSKLTAGLDLALFHSSKLVEKETFKDILRTCIGCHDQIQLDRAIDTHSTFVPLYNGPLQKAHHAVVYPGDDTSGDESSEDLDPETLDEVTPSFPPAYVAILQDDGARIYPTFSNFFLANNTTQDMTTHIPTKLPSVVPSFAKVKLASQVVFHTVLLDTGSDLCLIDMGFARKAIATFEKLFVKWTRNLLLGDGSSQMTISGFIPLLIHFQTATGTLVSVTQLFFCVDVLRECIIIGDIFFHTDQKEHGADMSPNRREMTLKGCAIPYTYRLKHIHLQTPCRIRIPGKSTVEVSFPLDKTFEGLTGHVYDKLNMVDILVLGRATSNLAGHLTLSLTNLSPLVRTLKAGENIGCFQQLLVILT
jgi:hypothetical protein